MASGESSTPQDYHHTSGVVASGEERQPFVYDGSKCQQNNPLASEGNGVLRCYSLNPRNFKDDSAKRSAIDVMTAELPRIAELGFNAVMVNPLVSLSNIGKPPADQFHSGAPLPEHTEHSPRRGSLYAMRDPALINEEWAAPNQTDEKDKQQALRQSIREFTRTARDNGLVPMYDIAFSHLAMDSPQVTEETMPVYDNDGNVKETINTSGWFGRYNGGRLQGKPVMPGVDHDGIVRTEEKLVWSDVAIFNYDDDTTRREIIEYLWEPYIDRLVDLGFTGLRVDSIAQQRRDVLDPVLAYFKKKVHEVWGIPEDEVIILGETLGAPVEHYHKTEHMTHAYSSAFWHDTGPLAKSRWECHHCDPHDTSHAWLPNQIASLRGVVRQDRPGGAIGYPGSWDEPGLAASCLDEGFTTDQTVYERNPNIRLVNLKDETIQTHDENTVGISNDNLPLFFRMSKFVPMFREQMAQTMLIPDGGFFFYGGEEYGALDQRSVFINHERGIRLADYDKRADFSNLLTDINHMIAALPVNIPGTWTTRRYLNSRPDLVIVERHTGKGLEGRVDLMIINLEPDKKAELTTAQIEELSHIVKLQPHKTLSVEDFRAAAHDPDSKENIVHPDRTVLLSREVLAERSPNTPHSRVECLDARESDLQRTGTTANQVGMVCGFDV